MLAESWNDKYLDYEIETKWMVSRCPLARCLETTSTSITRLKQSLPSLPLMKAISWNDKYLDYEIETTSRHLA